ncbi:MAG: penicillin acylase family protein [Bacteroidota bacterium]
MKIIKALISLAITGYLIYFLQFGAAGLPALGKFLNPFTGFWTNSEIKNSSSESEVSTKDLKLPDLIEEVSIKYDENGVPHIFAKNNHDLYFAQGFVTAQDRLWQMEFQTHFAAGRISEIVGEKGLESDLYQRRMGAVYGAENSLAGMLADPNSKLSLDSYAAGVNAYISQLSELDLPFEYKLLGYKPEPWTPLKSALFLKNMSFVLASGSDELMMTNIAQKYGLGVAEELFPNYPNDESPIIPVGSPIDFKPLPLPETIPTFIGKGSKIVPAEQNKSIGSNNWAVSGSKSVNGMPILSNDPHLGLNLPSIWYQIQLHSPGVNVYGSSMPGTPNVIIGFNQNIAWGVTNVGADIMDWYEVKFKDDSKNEYWHDNQWKKVTKRLETIKVKGLPDKIDTVLYTHHGPVVYQSNQKAFKSNIPVGHALKWIAHESSQELTTFYKLNRAKNYAQYVEALSYYSAPAQNFIFASNENDIAIWVNGRFPLKARQSGKYTLDGSDAKADWNGYIPPAHNPHVKNPNRGFVSSANQSSTDPNYPYYINWEFAASFRGRRINERLEKMEKATPDSLRMLQNDNFNIWARDILPTLLEKIKTSDTKLAPALKELKNWNRQNTIESIAPTIFDEWMKNLTHAIWKDEFDSDKDLPMKYPSDDKTIQLIKSEPNSKWFDDVSTKNKKETLEELLSKSLSATLDSITAKKGSMGPKWAWADWKNTSIKHLLGASNPALDRFSRLNVPIGGGKTMVNAANSRWGPSWRMVVQLDKKQPKAYGIFPGGQSGNPGSSQYDNMIDKWAKGELNELLYLQNREEASPRIRKVITFSK